MQDSSRESSDGATSVLFPLFLCRPALNVLQHAWNSNQLAVWQQADILAAAETRTASKRW